MTESIHPAAPHHLPLFITAPGETDVLMVVMAIVLMLFTLMVGIFYFRLHALPERFAHNKVQLEIVCVLALLAMFTDLLSGRHQLCAVHNGPAVILNMGNLDPALP